MKAVFLDIDGVMQAHGDQDRFEHIEEFVDLSKRLTKELNNGFDYYKFGGDYYEGTHCSAPAAQYDIAAVYYDWRPNVVERLRHILDSTGAKIVLSSDWREKGLDNMRGLLDIHGLGKYLYPTAPFCVPYGKSFMKENYSEEQLHTMFSETQTMFQKIDEKMRELYPGPPEKWLDHYDTRTSEIREYLDRHREIDAYVAIDDRTLLRGLDGHFVKTYCYIKEEHVQQALEILNRQDGPYPLPDEIKTDELEEWRRKWVYDSKFY
ncbi:MAG: hypothetical protein IJ150_00695 [Bacteroidales bacterium]|nr:hypothetical protein [Bacteroidales bacterium]